MSDHCAARTVRLDGPLFIRFSTPAMLQKYLKSASSEACVKRFILAVLIVTLSGGVTADEGMWTFDNLPKAEISKRYGVQLNDQWLAHVQKSVIRLESGCT